MSATKWLHSSCRLWAATSLPSIPCTLVCPSKQLTLEAPLLGSKLLFITTKYISGNHTGYKQFKGTKTSAEEISQLYAGLKQNYLTDFDVMLTGYAPSAEAVEAIGAIARDLKLQGSTKAGSFFWGI